MSDEYLGDRRKALEDSFFAKENERALARIREAKQAEATKEGLRAASGIADDSVLDELVELGFNADTIAALSLYPMIAVAWADRVVKATERRAILDAAHDAGLDRGNVAYDVLESWLEKRPGVEVDTAWCDVASSLAKSLDADSIAKLKQQVLGRAHEVAVAAGGFLGLGNKVSAAERAVLDQLEAAFAN
jgi:hypothetical protein